jgi:phage N-6-adenine-methyltransferase
MKALHSSNKHDWETPKDLFDQLNAEFNFEIDLAANEDNAKCSNYVNEKYDSLRCLSWDNCRAWLNPPYGRSIGRWVKKAAEAKNSTIVMLVPARTDTNWWSIFWDYKCHRPKTGVEVRFLKGRLKFGGSASSAPFPSAIVIFNG